MLRHNNLFSARFFHAVFHNTTIKESWKKIQTWDVSRFSRSELTKMLIDVFPEYHFQELQNQITTLLNRLYDNGERKEEMLDFFDVLFEFSKEMIVRSDNRYRFKYIYTDIWRTVVKEIGEEIFVISAIVQDDIRRNNTNRIQMDWTYCIEHDNHELKRMLQRDNGVSDNHFHLRGSSPYFDISWVYLMNHIAYPQYEKQIEEIEADILNNYPSKGSEYSLKLVWRKAAAIRLFLYMCLAKTEKEKDMQGWYYCIANQVLPYESESVCTFPLKEIQEECDGLNTLGTIDYAHRYSQCENQKYFSISGERYILYHCLRKIVCHETGYELIKQMLFLYLMLKNRFYAEFVQSNSRIGFYNFNQYQYRKDGFIPWSHERAVAADTIASVIEGNKIYRMELRISPQKSQSEMVNSIQTYDAAITDALSRADFRGALKTEENFFYTLHFVKRKEKFQEDFCRHQVLRQEIEHKARVIFDLPYDAAKRIDGIDACGEEMDCRPEVFAPMFRFLQYYDTEKRQIDNSLLQQLNATYHVGEDNYDLADGLRAIDEAITFLDLRSGSRLGHATLLGISPEKYYSEIRNPLAIPIQIFLDNIVWMYYYFKEHDVEFKSYARLRSYLEEKFELYFNKIYSDDIYSPLLQRRWKAAVKAGYFHTDESYDNSDKCRFDMQHYYLSYLLRGDDPLLYKDGFIHKSCVGTQEYRICSTKDRMKEARDSFEACFLYHLYHYSKKVWENGNQCVIEKLPDFFLDALAAIQADMKRNISRESIGIETNPTSNVFISAISDYSEHPISDFYDNALKKDPSKVQLNVSINTDDKSVFSTCLSNEYAYLLFYLENKKDSDGNYMYSRFEIMKWLDEIRKMGNEQTFAY